MSIRPGDIVRIHYNALTWKVVAILPTEGFDDDEMVCLESGQTGRRRTEPLENLTIFKTGGTE